MLIDLHLREDILEHFPNFEYFNCAEPGRLDFSKPGNLVGDQQEAFLLYFILKQLREHGGVGLDIGCGQGSHFGCIGLDKYYGKSHPQYGGEYLPHVTSLAENITCFNEGTFNFIVAAHILEHVTNPIITFRQWLKLLKKDGLIILLMPDKNFEKPCPWDASHRNFYTPEDFRNNCILPNQDLIQELELNSLNNNFSMNFVGRRI